MIAPQRTCIGCRQVKAKKDLIRIVRSPVQAFEKSLNKASQLATIAPHLSVGETGIPACHNTGKMPVPPKYNFLDKNKRGNTGASAPVEAIIAVDLRGKEKGRGAYVCPNIDCINRAMQPERLNKAFRIIPSSSDCVGSEAISRLKQSLLGLIQAQQVISNQ